MAEKNPFAVKAERIRALVKAFMQEAPQLMQVYMNDYMGEDIGAPAFKASERGGALSLRPPKNETGRLRIQTGNLVRSFIPNERGNITKVEIKGNTASLEYGISLREIPYARIHEYGGTAGRGVALRARPYMVPAFAAFRAKEIPRFYKRLIKEIES